MKKSGFTVIEMLLTISIMGIVLSIGAPSFSAITRSSDMIANSSDIVTALNYARIEAIKRGNSIYLGQRTDGSWTDGVVVWVDSDNDDTMDSGEEIRIWQEFSLGSSLTSENHLTRFVFNASGEINNTDVLTLCDDRTEETGRTISILKSGAVFAKKVTCE